MAAAGAKKRDDELTFVTEELGADLDALLVFSILRTHSYLSPLCDAALRGRHITGAQFNAMLLLRSAGKAGLKMGELGERLVVTKSNVTGLIDRMERQGLAERAGASDRRATVVRLTKAGRALLDRAAPRHAEQLSELTACLSAGEKRTLIRLHSKLRRELRQLRRKKKGAA